MVVVTEEFADRCHASAQQVNIDASTSTRGFSKLLSRAPAFAEGVQG